MHEMGSSSCANVALVSRRLRHLVLTQGNAHTKALSLAHLNHCYQSQFAEPLSARLDPIDNGKKPVADLSEEDVILRRLDPDTFEATYEAGKLALRLKGDSSAALEGADEEASRVTSPLPQHFSRQLSDALKGALEYPIKSTVVVQEVTTPSDFWVTLGDSARHLNALMDELNEDLSQARENGPATSKDIKLGPGEPCAALYDNEWHRASVQSVYQDESTGETKCDLMFFDYGTVCKGIAKSEVRGLPPRFALLSAQAFRAKLADVGPPLAWRRSQWPDDSCVRFLQMVRESVKGAAGAEEASLGVLPSEITAVEKDNRGQLILTLRILDPRITTSVTSANLRDLGSLLVYEGLACSSRVSWGDVVDSSFRKLMRDQATALDKLKSSSAGLQVLGKGPAREFFKKAIEEQGQINRYLKKLSAEPVES